ncbi:DUF305 domain-containing protein [Streptomyces sp. ZYX-F-203]|uniref:DUF305 domain-containing protein n=1 Tax=Streptomyces sp. HSG2 TaxID=2797167 RepID=UPI001F5B9BD1|nr:DUF305 domain-containing protein [Streptomyces sp. HSG2]
MPFRPAPRSPRVVAVAALAALLLAGCEGDADTDAATSGEPAVVAPGLPGEGNRTLSAEEARESRVDDDSPNSADVTYARDMIVHHEQALVMTALVPERATSEAVTRIAERIAAAQGPEIDAMRGWLSEHGEKETEAHGHDHHAAMPGMATESQLDDLRDARGESFDRLFLRLMITHHEGALTMVADVKAQGNNVRIEEMADDVVATQTSEIGRMRAML